MPFTLPKFDADSLKKELQPSALKGRAQALNDRFSSPSSSNTGYDRYSPANHARPTPPVTSTASHASVSSNQGYAPPLPPVRRTGQTPALQRTASHEIDANKITVTGASSVPPPPPPRTHSYFTQTESSLAPNPTPPSTYIDWRHVSPSDKASLFDALDAFFSGSTASKTALAVNSKTNVVQPPLAPPAKPTKKFTPAQTDVPPPPPLWARPPATHSGTTQPMSYPLPCQTTSHAHDVANYFLPSTRWTSNWFTSKDLSAPPVLENRADMTWSAGWSQLGSKKTLIGVAMFSDLSVVWWRIRWSTDDERRPGFLDGITREAKYLDAPQPFTAESLWDACATYGEQVAQFAEHAERGGRPIAHGECWDLASQALASVTGLEPPIPSIARTHGHLIYSGSSNGKDSKRDQQGTWRGGDTAIRRGDIVEWRKVRIQSPQKNGWSELGNPDHTAIIVQCYLSGDPSANKQPQDGQSLQPWECGILEVIEQSQGKLPSKAVYDLSGMESGEVWIYRPVSMKAYLGIDELKPDWNQITSRGSIHLAS